MKKIAYFNPFSGISGDMTLGACVDAGMDFDNLAESIAKLKLDGYKLSREKVVRKGIAATRVIVDIEESHHHRGLPQIEEIINNSDLSDDIKHDAIAVFRTLGQAEAAVHEMPIEKVHFHEVGAMDSIIDIVGACVCFHTMGIDEIYSSSLALGGGTVKCAHGLMPVPAPATVRLIEGLPSHGGPVDKELTTPTGAAILKTLATGFGSQPAMTVKSVGYGSGTMEFEHANVLPLIIGEAVSFKGRFEQITIIETSIDDMTGEQIGALCDKLMTEGAKEVYTSPLFMKKNRPGTSIVVMCDDTSAPKLGNILMAESSTRGYRIRYENRYCLDYEIKQVDTKFGKISVKFSEVEPGRMKIKPEYDDVKRIADEANLSFSDVYNQIMREID